MARAFLSHPITDERALGGSSIERSLRFEDSENVFLTRTPSSTGNRRTWTFSVWVKHNINGVLQTFFSSGTNNPDTIIKFTPSDQFEISRYGGSYQNQVTSTPVLRDTGAWYHLVGAVDTTQGTASNRVKMYINGTQVTTFANSSYPSQNYEYPEMNNSGTPVYIGRHGHPTTQNFDGYLAEFHFFDGVQLTPELFGYTEFQTGIWKPKKYAGGNYGTNGFYLNFSDNSGTTATTLGKDYSGNGNDFTPNNFSVSAGEGNDSLLDTPTNNFCTLNPLDVYGDGVAEQIKNGNLEAKNTSGSSYRTTRSTFYVTTGKWYWEVKVLAVGTVVLVGVAGKDYNAGSGARRAYNSYNGNKYIGSGSSYGATFTTNDIIGIALDLDNGTITFYKNGASQGVAFTDMLTAMVNGGWTPIFNGYGNSEGAFNFGQRPFSYTPPTGHSKLSSNNLPVNNNQQVIRPEKHMKTLIWTGNSTNNRRITGLEFKPDLVWIKKRDVTIMSHYFISSAQTYTSSGSGNGNVGAFISGTNSNETVGTTSDGGFVSFNNDGFTLGKGNNDNNADSAYQRMNANSANYVAWCWKAGGAPVTNNEGTVTASVSANPQAGFSMVKYTGSGGHVTRGHGLGRKPQWIIMKTTSHSGNWWFNLDDSAIPDAGYDRNYLRIDNTAGVEGPNGNIAPSVAPDNSAAITDTIYSLGGDMNESGKEYVNYLWASVPGYSKIGSYIGNTSADGPFIYTGFPIAWLMIKRASGTGPWNIWDISREPNGNPRQFNLNAGSSAYEDNGRTIGFYSNGFKIRNNGTEMNNGTYIYLALAKQTGTTAYQTEPNAQ